MRIAFLIAIVGASQLATGMQRNASPTPVTDEEKALYSMGVMLAFNLLPFELTEQEMTMLRAGLTDGAKDAAKLKPEEVEATLPKIRELQQQRSLAALEREKKGGSEALARAAGEPGAVKTDSGLVYKTAKEGSGASPQETDVVKVHYEGRLATSGKVFDSSKERGEPAEFPLDQVIPCWTEGVQKMKVGGTARLVCPPELAYGDEGSPPQMPAGATLVFDVELIDVIRQESRAAGPAAE